MTTPERPKKSLVLNAFVMMCKSPASPKQQQEKQATLTICRQRTSVSRSLEAPGRRVLEVQPDAALDRIGQAARGGQVPRHLHRRRAGYILSSSLHDA